MDIDNKSQAYDNGWHAYTDGKDFTMDNPYPSLYQPIEWHEWQQGWIDNQQEQREQWDKATGPIPE